MLGDTILTTMLRGGLEHGPRRGGRQPGYKTRYKGGYFPVPPLDYFAEMRNEMCLRLAEVGLDGSVGFGSPTIRINGVDPFRVAGQSPAYACRVYASPAGLSGVPPLDDVISALTAASDREPASPE